MPLPANIVYLCWNGFVSFQECEDIVQGFADDNFTEIVDSNIWYEEGDHTLTCMCVIFSHLIYKIKCDTLAYNGNLGTIATKRILGSTTINLDEWKNYMSKCQRKDDYLTTYYSLATFWQAPNRLHPNGGCIFWVVDADQYITKILTTNVVNPYMSGNRDYMSVINHWKVYDDPYQIPVEVGKCTLYPTEEPDTRTYHHLNNVIDCGVVLLVVTPWIPCLPLSVDHRRWCFAKVKKDSDGEADWSPFIPERVSKAKSARK